MQAAEVHLSVGEAASGPADREAPKPGVAYAQDVPFSFMMKQNTCSSHGPCCSHVGMIQYVALLQDDIDFKSG